MRLHVAEAGEGPLVLLLHGFPEFWWTWRAQLPALAAEGPETGLAAHAASGHAVLIALGALGTLDLAGFTVLLAEDYPRHSKAAKALGLEPSTTLVAAADEVIE